MGRSVAPVPWRARGVVICVRIAPMNALNIAEYTHLGLQAKTASALMARAPAATKNKALLALARLLRENVQALQADNAADLARPRRVA